MATDIAINILSQFVGKQAFKQADTATDKLTKNVKNLGRTLGVTLSVGAVLAFGKASVRAAAEDEKAQKQLALALKNVGLGRDAAASEAYIQRLQTEFGILDDDLRPAYQSLAIATKSTAESQNLMNIALDVAAANSLDVGKVTAALSKAYLGNNAALAKLGIGISKADLATKSFDEIMKDLSKTFKGAASQSANTFAGKMARLTVSIENAKEILGKGLIDSFMILTDSAGIEELQVKIENFANSASEGFKKLAGFVKENLTLLKTTLAIFTAMFVSSKIIQGIAATVTAIGTIKKAFTALRATAVATAIANMFALNPYGAAAQVAAMVALIGITIKGVDALVDAYNRAGEARDYALDPKKYDNAATAFDKQFKGQEKLVKKAKVLTAEELKQLNAKKLQLAIDKAKLALGKGADVFDMEKIQLAAATLNTTRQLADVTNQAQLLQITNDLARLRVKQSMVDLDDAIAAKDIAAIEAGTAKLNKDLLILGALTNQKLQLRDIESILKSIVPKDLISISNLEKAMDLLKIIAAMESGKMPTHAAPILGDPNASPKGFPTAAAINDALAKGSFVPVVPGTGGVMGGSANAGAYASSGFPGSAMGYGGASNVNITINAGLGTDPEELARVVENVFNQSTQRGTSTNRDSGVYVL
jgi:hypothetical protein